MPRAAKGINKNLASLNPRRNLRYKICVSGAAETGHCSSDTIAKAEAVGRHIAEAGMILVTGATTGVPYWAAKGAKEAGGFVIGFSPAASEAAHIKTYHLPTDYHDVIVYTGFDYAGRDIFVTRASDAVVTICGRIGTIHEFTTTFEDHKPSGVLEGSGGAADMLREILVKAKRGLRSTIFDTDPKRLVAKLISMISVQEIANHNHHRMASKTGDE